MTREAARPPQFLSESEAASEAMSAYIPRPTILDLVDPNNDIAIRKAGQNCRVLPIIPEVRWRFYFPLIKQVPLDSAQHSSKNG